MNSIKISAQAKVNLFLKILKKRKDGYHNILTLFERISLSDKITISKIPSGIRVSSDKFITADPKDNLAYKAAELILKCKRAEKGLKGINKGVKISIKKNIPIAAGLGGGSSDAASVLMGVNKLFGLRLKQKELIAMGKRLGADVPFFLLDTPFAAGTLRGDKLKKMHCRSRLWHFIVYPGFKLATRDVYKAFDLLTTKKEDVKIPFTFMLDNDLERAAIAKRAVLGHIIECLASYLGRKAVVSGSGPSVFCLCRTGKEAREAKRRVFRRIPAGERKGWQVFIARTEA